MSIVLSLTKLEKQNLETILKADPNCPVKQGLLAKLNKPPKTKQLDILDAALAVAESGQQPSK